MWDAMNSILGVVSLVVLVLASGGAVLLVAMQLPGTWLMLAMCVLTVWWRGTDGPIGIWTLLVLAILAVLGELVELMAGSVGAARAGGTRRGAVLALVGGMAGALAGAILLPVPLLGPIVGACVGAGCGSVAGDRWASRPWGHAMAAGKGAAFGKLWGTLAKLVVALAMWFVVIVAVLWP